MKPPRLTIASLMIVVAGVALLMYLVLHAPSQLFFGLLPVLAAAFGVGYRRLQPKGFRAKPSQQIMVGLIALALLSPLFALRVSLLGNGPTVADRINGFFSLVGIGVAPLVIFLSVAGILRCASWQQNRVMPPGGEKSDE